MKFPKFGPFKKPPLVQDRLVFSLSEEDFSYVHGVRDTKGMLKLQSSGRVRSTSKSIEKFADQVRLVAPLASEVFAMLTPSQYHLMQVEPPAVAEPDVKAAVRNLIRDSLDRSIDEVTIDVMKLGDGRQKGAGHLVVAVVPNEQLRNIQEFASLLKWPLSVIDIQDNAHRNLQIRQSKSENASALLMAVNQKQALLTITANKELFFSRRLEMPAGYMEQGWAQALSSASESRMHSLQHPLLRGELALSDNSAFGLTAAAMHEPDRGQKFFVDIQRTIDLWERTWVGLPIDTITVEVGEDSEALAQWLSHRLGQPVDAADTIPINSAFTDSYLQCAPLIGAMLRAEDSVRP